MTCPDCEKLKKKLAQAQERIKADQMTITALVKARDEQTKKVVDLVAREARRNNAALKGASIVVCEIDETEQ